MRRILIQLSETDRQTVQTFRTHGIHRAREMTRAHILAALDHGVSDKHIRQVLGVSAMVIWRTRSAYQEQGVTYALNDAPRGGAPRRYQAAQEAEVMALACSQPPTGRKRWTLKLLAKAARQRPALDKVSLETIRRFLKKTS
jgi:transposase